MAIPKIKATYTLDPETIETLESMARRWQVSKSEALRRAIRSAAELQQSSPEESPTELLDRLQRELDLDEASADWWIEDVRRERRESRPLG